MPTGKQIITLLKGIAYKQYKAVNSVATEMAEYENEKGHTELAAQIKSLCNIITEKNLQSFKALPVDNDSRRNLMELKKYNIPLNKVIVSDANMQKLNKFFIEYNNRDLFIPYDIRANHRLLFCGESGCGKTTLAKAIATELSYEMLYVDLSAVITSYLGKTSNNLCRLFETAGEQPCVLFLDEFDALARSRNEKGQDVQEMKRVVNTLLQILDNFDNETIIIAATNLEDTIDKAIFRRFDDVLYFKKPENKDIKNTIYLKMQDYKFDLEVLSELDKLTGLTYADIEQICHTSLKHCIINKIPAVTKDIFTMAIESQKSRNKVA